MVVYAKLLNNMTDEEWCARGLDKAVHTNPMPNIQLAHLCNEAAYEPCPQVALASRVVGDFTVGDFENEPPAPNQCLGTDYEDNNTLKTSNFKAKSEVRVTSHTELENVYSKEIVGVRWTSMPDLLLVSLSDGQPSCLPPSVPSPISPTRRRTCSL